MAAAPKHNLEAEIRFADQRVLDSWSEMHDLCTNEDGRPFDAEANLADILDRVDMFLEAGDGLRRLLAPPILAILSRERLRRTLDPAVIRERKGLTLHHVLLGICEEMRAKVSLPLRVDYETYQDRLFAGLSWVADTLAPAWHEDIQLRLEIEILACSPALPSSPREPARLKQRRPRGTLDSWACEVVRALEERGKHDWTLKEVARLISVQPQTLSDKLENGKWRYPMMRTLFERRELERRDRRDAMVERAKPGRSRAK